MAEKIRLYFQINLDATTKDAEIRYFTAHVQKYAERNQGSSDIVVTTQELTLIISTYPQYATLIIDAMNSRDGVMYYKTENEK